MESEEIHSFYFKDTINGVEIDYRITQNEGHFGIEKDGILVAEVQNNEKWEQTSGEPLPDDLLQKIFHKIEDKYE